MKGNFRITLVTVAASAAIVIFALSVAGDRSPIVQLPPDSFNGITAALHHPHCDHDRQALADMYAHARADLGEFHARPDTFHGTSEWSRDWVLHWIDVDLHGSHVRIYHAVHKHRPHHRFTLISDSRSPHPASWKDAH